MNRQIGLVVAVLAILLFVFGVAGRSLYQSRRQHEERAAVTTQNLANTLAINVDGILDKIEVGLFDLANEVQRQLTSGAINNAQLTAYLDRQKKQVREFEGLWVADQAGNIHWGTEIPAGQPVNIADRDYFKRLKESPDSKMVLSKPVIGRVTKTWSILIAERVNKADGSFAGVVLGSLRVVDYFGRMFSGLNVGPHGLIDLRDEELALIVRYPKPADFDQLVGSKVVSAKTREVLWARPAAATYTAAAAVDGIERTISYQKVEGWPLCIFVSSAIEDFLAPWWREVAITAVLLGVFSVVAVASTRIIFLRTMEMAAAAELRKEAARLSLILEATSDGFWSWDILTGNTVFNRGYTSMLGYSPEEFPASYQAWEKLVHPDDLERVRTHCQEHFQQHKEYSIEFRMRERSGRWHWLHSRGLLIERDPQGNPARMVGTHTNIDERKQAEERLRIATFAAQIGVWDWDVIRNELVWDDSMYRLYGVRRDEFAGAYQAWISCVHPDDMARVDRDVQAALRGEKEFAPEFRVIRRDGGAVRIFQSASQTLRDKEGRPYRMIGTNVDITERKAAEVELAYANELLERTGEMAKVGGWELDVATQRVKWSAETARIHEVELPAEEPLMKSGDRYYDPDAWQIVQAAVQAAIEHGTPYDLESLFITAKGKRIWVRVQGFPVKEGGRTVKLRGTFQDITASKQAREAARASDERYRRIVETAQEGIFNFDANWLLEYSNARFAEILGYTKEEIIGRHIGDIILREDESDHETRKARQMKGVAGTYENAYRTKSGAPVWLSVSVSPILQAGKFAGSFGMVTDITARKKAEQALQESAQSLRLQGAALAATVNAVMITAPTGAIVWVNPAFTHITGYALAEVAGQTPRILKSGKQSRQLYEDLWRTITSGRSWTGEMVNLRKDGSQYHAEVTITPVRDQTGAMTHYVAVTNDITQRKSLEKQLFDTQRLESIGLLASGIAHDLNNIIAPISLSLEIMRKKYPNEQRTIDMIGQSAKRGADIVRQVLTFARGMDSARAPLRVSRLIKEVTHLMAETLPRNIELSYDIAAREDTAQVDPTQLHQVLLNLVVNARDAMPAGGKLSISLTNVSLSAEDEAPGVGSKPGDYVAIAVTDTGSGMPPEILPRIFDPFFTTKPQGQGTGLGLSTVHGIVRNHGGFVQVQSTVGVGTTFKVYLPLINHPGSGPKSEAGDTVIAGRGRGILVADDEATIREITRDVLEGHDFKVFMAEDGHQAVEVFRSHRLDIRLVLLDRMMPGQGGEAAALAIHSLEPQVPIILATGLFAKDDPAGIGQKFNNVGVVATLQKPFTAPQLMALIAEHL